MSYLWIVIPVLAGVSIGYLIIRHNYISLSRFGRPVYGETRIKKGKSLKTPTSSELSPKEFRVTTIYAPQKKLPSQNIPKQ